MLKRRLAALGMFGFGFGFFCWFVPYSALVKAISSGLLPGIDHSVSGLALLPAAAVGQLLAMLVFMSASGWWRDSRRCRIAGRNVPFPTRYTAESAFWMSLVIGSTTLLLTFPDAPIVFLLVLMWTGTLVIMRSMDQVRGGKVPWYSAAAMTLALLSAAVALTDIDHYMLPFGAVLSLGLFALGHLNRFRIMGVHGRTGDQDIDRRYLVEEHLAVPVILLLITGVPALVGLGAWSQSLRSGFTAIVASPEVFFPALLIGVCYEGLFVMATLIHLDKWKFVLGMPVHVCSGLLAGAVAAIGLNAVFGAPPPSRAQYIAAGMVIFEAFLLGYPPIRAALTRRYGRPPAAERRMVLFVCGGNTRRSPMAMAIARAELVALGGTEQWQVESAGLSVGSPGAPLSRAAAKALRELGVDPPSDHRSRQFDPAMCLNTDVVYCMTREQHDSVIALVPAAVERAVCLDPEADVAEPVGRSVEAYRDCAADLRVLVRDRLREQRELYALSAAAASV